MVYSKRRKNLGGGRRKSNKLRMKGGMMFFEKLFPKSMLDDIDIVDDTISEPLIKLVLNSMSTPFDFKSSDNKEYTVWKNKDNGLCIQLKDDYDKFRQINKCCISSNMTDVFIDNKGVGNVDKIQKVKSFFNKHLLVHLEIVEKNRIDIVDDATSNPVITKVYKLLLNDEYKDNFKSSDDKKYTITKKNNQLCIHDANNNRYCISGDMKHMFINDIDADTDTNLKSFFYKHLSFYLKEIDRIEKTERNRLDQIRQNNLAGAHEDIDSPVTLGLHLLPYNIREKTPVARI